jgi:hypothetical protein
MHYHRGVIMKARACGSTLLVALAVSACATTPEANTTQSLLASMSAPRAVTLATCKAANKALVCHGGYRHRTVSSLERRCACADPEQLIGSGR